MSYQVGSVCYAAKGSAYSAIASDKSGAIVLHGGSSYVVTAKAGSAGVDYVYSPIGGGLGFSQSVVFDPSPCALLDLSDGLVLGWGVALAWVCAWGLGYIARFVNRAAVEGDS